MVIPHWWRNRIIPRYRFQRTIYVGSRDKKLYAIDFNKNKKWEFITGAALDASPIIDIDGTVYIAALDPITLEGKTLCFESAGM